MSLTPPLFSSPDDLPVDLFPFDFEPMIPFDEEGGVTIVEENYIEVAQKRMSTENGHAFKSNLSVAANKARELIAQARSSIYNSQILKSEIHRIVRDFSISANYFYTHCNSYSQGKKIHAKRSLEIQDSIANGRGDFKLFARPSREKTEASTTVASSFDIFLKGRINQSVATAQLGGWFMEGVDVATEFTIESARSMAKYTIDLIPPLSRAKEVVERALSEPKPSLSQQFMALCLADTANDERTCRATLDFAKKIPPKIQKMFSKPESALSNRLIQLGIPKEIAQKTSGNAGSLLLAGIPAGPFLGGMTKKIISSKAGEDLIKGDLKSFLGTSYAKLSGREKKVAAASNYTQGIVNEAILLKELGQVTPLLTPSEQLSNFFNSPFKKVYEQYKYSFSSAREGARNGGKLDATLLFKRFDNEGVFRIRYDGLPKLVKSTGLYAPERLEILLHAAFQCAQEAKLSKVVFAYDSEVHALTQVLQNHFIPIERLGTVSAREGARADLLLKPLTLVEVPVPTTGNPIQILPLRPVTK